MLVLLHVSIAISSLIYTGYVFLSPSKARIYGVYGFIAATLISGGVLAFVAHASLLSVCVSGLLYLGIVSIGIVASHKKLAKESAADL
ncbi:MAG TPA: hypothetical protein VIK37_00310 [Candidatus Saccharimonadales bacterium]